MESLTKNNCQLLLATFIEKNKLIAREVAKAIGCSEATLSRIIAGETLPTDKMLKEIFALMAIGFNKYSKLSKSEKESISEAIGVVSGGTLGFAAMASVISTLGAVTGLSAAGITSGLGALGAMVSGSMVAGIGVAAAIPIAVGALGYGAIKAAKSFCKKYKTDQQEYDPEWEMPLEVGVENELKEEKMTRITMGNDDFILYIRKRFSDCDMRTDQLGKKIWIWLRETDPTAVKVEESAPCYWGDSGDFISENQLPKTATQFSFEINILPELYRYLNELGMSNT